MTPTSHEPPVAAVTGLETDADFFGLDEQLDERELAVRDAVRRFGRDQVLPIIDEHWEAASFPWELLPGLAELGIIGTVIRGHGCPGLSRKAAGVVGRELARADGSINTFLGVHSGLSMGSIDLLGDEDQKQRWLPPMARLAKTGAFALTEPDHGSDSVSLETSARRDGDHWVLDGHKRWIGNGDTADVVVVFARNAQDGEVNAFVVEKDEDGAHPAGYRPEVITGKIGKRAIRQSDIVLDGVRVPDSARLRRCASFDDVNRVLAATRGGAAWEAVGHAMACYEIAADYARRREQFGRPIGGFQLVQSRLANMLAELTAMQLLVYRMADLAERGELSVAQASLVKMTAAQRATWICREARDLLGGNGLLLSHHVARHMTDMEVVATYEGTDSVQALIVGRDITGMSAFT